MNLVDRFWELIDTDPSEFDIAILRGADDEGDPFILSEGHLGLNASDLAWLARDFRSAYRKIRQRHSKELSDVTVTEESLSTHHSILKTTSCLLLVCPDNATAWADRKRALLCLNNSSNDTNQQDYVHEIWSKELEFLNLLMTKHTKAPTSWFHRKYVFQRLLVATQKMEGCTTTHWMNLVGGEIKVCTRVADRYPKNYYAWTHRIYVLQTLYNQLFCHSDASNHPFEVETKDGSDPKLLFSNLIQEEWQFITDSWLWSHVSDHSAAHFGGRVLNMLGEIHLKQQPENDGKETTKNEGLLVMTQAVEGAGRLVETYPTHEVLWIFRRICSHEFLTYSVKAMQRKTNSPSTEFSNFYSQEITSLLEEDKAAKGDRSINDSKGSRLEADQTRIYRLSYVAWVLKDMLAMVRQGQIDVSALDLFREEQLCSLSALVIERLKEIDDIPAPIYKKNETKPLVIS